MIAPIIVTLPAIPFAGAASGLSDDEGAVRARFRDQAYAAAGLSEGRGPSLRDRLAMWIGRKPAQAVVKRARADLASGLWGAKPVDGRYHIEGEAVTPLPLPRFDFGPTTKIRIKADGGGLIAYTTGGKLQSLNGRPSAPRVDQDGRLASAAWHDDGVALGSWKAGPAGLNFEIGILAAELRFLADEIRHLPGNEHIVGVLDRLHDSALDMSMEARMSVVPVPIVLAANGAVDVEALTRSLASDIATDIQAPVPRR